MNLLITGGAGFIGSNLVRYMLKKHPDDKVINLDKLTYAGNLESLSDIESGPGYSFVKGDICDKELVRTVFEEHSIDAVIHLAAESHVDRSILGPEVFVETNVMGTLTLLETARSCWGKGADHRFVHVSTDEVYGSIEDPDKFFTEQSPYRPSSPYAASKAASDHLADAYFRTYGLPVIITNCTNNYGPYQFPEKLIPLMILNAIEGRKLPVYGDGLNVRDWIYVTDHAAALDAVLSGAAPGERYNIGGGSEWRNIDLVNRICDILDRFVSDSPRLPHASLIEFVKDRPGHDRRYAVDSSKIKRELGWEPEHSFDEGLDATVRWYMEHDKWLGSVVSGEYKEYYSRNYSKR